MSKSEASSSARTQPAPLSSDAEKYVDVARVYGHSAHIRDTWGVIPAQVYPHQAPHWSGKVIVRAYIGRAGNLDRAELIQPSRIAWLDDAAFDDVLRMSFEPVVAAAGQSLAYSIDFDFAFDGAARSTKVSVDTSYPAPVRQASSQQAVGITPEQIAILQDFYQRYERTAKIDVSALGAGEMAGMTRSQRNQFLQGRETRGLWRLNAKDLHDHAAFFVGQLKDPDFNVDRDLHPSTAFLLSMPIMTLQRYTELRLRALEADAARRPALRSPPTREEAAAGLAAAQAIISFDTYQRVLAIVHRGKAATQSEKNWLTRTVYEAALRLPAPVSDSVLLSILPRIPSVNGVRSPIK